MTNLNSILLIILAGFVLACFYKIYKPYEFIDTRELSNGRPYYIQTILNERRERNEGYIDDGDFNYGFVKDEFYE